MAKKKIKTITWSKNTTKQYYQILEYLTEEAPDAVDIVGNALLDMIGSLTLEYNNYPPDRFKKDNDGTFKAALVFNYRVSYRITETDIYILRIRHTSREPMNY